MVNKGNKFETDHVYSEMGTGEFKSVHLEVSVVRDKLQLIIRSEEVLSKLQLEEILNDLQKTTFKKLEISLADDCVILVKVGEETDAIEITDKAIRIKSILKL